MVNQQQPENGASEQEILSPKSVARRRFTKAGAAASGVLLTLHSTSALAGGGGGGGGTVCTTGSGSMSTGVNSRAAVAVTCTGGGPNYWSNNGWPTGCKKSDLYGGTFSCGGTMGNSQFWDIVTKNNTSFDSTQLCKYLACAYLNVVSGKTNFTNKANLQKMWNEYRTAGYYSPAANVKWYAADIVAYLKKTNLYT